MSASKTPETDALWHHIEINSENCPQRGFSAPGYLVTALKDKCGEIEQERDALESSRNDLLEALVEAHATLAPMAKQIISPRGGPMHQLVAKIEAAIARATKGGGV